MSCRGNSVLYDRARDRGLQRYYLEIGMQRSSQTGIQCKSILQNRLRAWGEAMLTLQFFKFSGAEKHKLFGRERIEERSLSHLAFLCRLCRNSLNCGDEYKWEHFGAPRWDRQGQNRAIKTAALPYVIIHNILHSHSWTSNQNGLSLHTRHICGCR